MKYKECFCNNFLQIIIFNTHPNPLKNLQTMNNGKEPAKEEVAAARKSTNNEHNIAIRLPWQLAIVPHNPQPHIIPV